MKQSVESCLNTLELPNGASFADVKKAYRDLLRIWHPDRYQHDPRLVGRATQKTKELNEAYAYLCSVSDKESYRFTFASKENSRPNSQGTSSASVSNSKSHKTFPFQLVVLAVLAAAIWYRNVLFSVNFFSNYSKKQETTHSSSPHVEYSSTANEQEEMSSFWEYSEQTDKVWSTCKAQTANCNFHPLLEASRTIRSKQLRSSLQAQLVIYMSQTKDVEAALVTATGIEDSASKAAAISAVAASFWRAGLHERADELWRNSLKVLAGAAECDSGKFCDLDAIGRPMWTVGRFDLALEVSRIKPPNFALGRTYLLDLTNAIASENKLPNLKHLLNSVARVANEMSDPIEIAMVKGVVARVLIDFGEKLDAIDVINTISLSNEAFQCYSYILKKIDFTKETQLLSPLLAGIRKIPDQDYVQLALSELTVLLIRNQQDEVAFKVLHSMYPGRWKMAAICGIVSSPDILTLTSDNIRWTKSYVETLGLDQDVQPSALKCLSLAHLARSERASAFRTLNHVREPNLKERLKNEFKSLSPEEAKARLIQMSSETTK